MSGAGEGEVVSKEVGEEERGAQGCVDRRSDNATSVDVESGRGTQSRIYAKSMLLMIHVCMFIAVGPIKKL